MRLRELPTELQLIIFKWWHVKRVEMATVLIQGWCRRILVRRTFTFTKAVEWGDIRDAIRNRMGVGVLARLVACRQVRRELRTELLSWLWMLECNPGALALIVRECEAGYWK